ncbi:hypothetical protein C5167_027993 [Papaver somniferum]|nr:hypothetical protein C5167_027993 [Papaver somniferum]
MPNPTAQDVEKAEALAALEEIKQTLEHQVINLQIEGDCVSAANAINGKVEKLDACRFGDPRSIWHQPGLYLRDDCGNKQIGIRFFFPKSMASSSAAAESIKGPLDWTLTDMINMIPQQLDENNYLVWRCDVGLILECQSLRHIVDIKVPELRHRLLTLRKDGLSVDKYFHPIFRIRNVLWFLGHSVSDGDLVRCALGGLGHEYDGFVQGILARPVLPNIDQLYRLIADHDLLFFHHIE